MGYCIIDPGPVQSHLTINMMQGLARSTEEVVHSHYFMLTLEDEFSSPGSHKQKSEVYIVTVNVHSGLQIPLHVCNIQHLDSQIQAKLQLLAAQTQPTLISMP